MCCHDAFFTCQQLFCGWINKRWGPHRTQKCIIMFQTVHQIVLTLLNVSLSCAWLALVLRSWENYFTSSENKKKTHTHNNKRQKRPHRNENKMKTIFRLWTLNIYFMTAFLWCFQCCEYYSNCYCSTAARAIIKYDVFSRHLVQAFCEHDSNVFIK